MIVFLYIIIGLILISLFIVFVMLLSSVSVEIVKFDIKNADDLFLIMDFAVKKQYEEIFDYMDIQLKVIVNLFNILPVEINSFDNKKIKRTIIKEKQKRKKKSDIKNAIKDEKIKQIGKNVIDNYLVVDKVSIDAAIGVYDAYNTAIMSAVFIIILAILLSYITDGRIKQFKNNRKQQYYIRKNFKYEIDPIYENDLIIKFEFATKVTVQIASVIKELFMYKSDLFVNNTNKYSVKES